MAFHLLDLPAEMLQEIRLRLTSAARIQLKRCCKALFALDPHFDWPRKWKEHDQALLTLTGNMPAFVDAVIAKTRLGHLQLSAVGQSSLDFHIPRAGGRYEISAAATTRLSDYGGIWVTLTRPGSGTFQTFRYTLKEIDQWIETEVRRLDQ